MHATDHVLDWTAIGLGLPLAFVTASDIFQGMAATGALLAGVVQALRYWRESREKQASK